MGIYTAKMGIGGKDRMVAILNYDEDDFKTTTTKEISGFHHIHILDVSGSMSPVINPMVDSVQKSLDVLDENDLITIIWFSAPGQYRTLVKGMKKSPELVKLLDTLRRTLSTTCFSDPVGEARTIINELYNLCPNIVVTLFTDGCPVVSWGAEEEERRVFKIVEDFKDKVLAVNTIGFGSWYNKDFLTKLASMTQFGVFAHSLKIEDYSEIFNRNFEVVSGMVFDSINIESPDKDIVYLNRNFTKMESGKFELSRIDRRKNQFFIISHDDKPFTFEYQGTMHTTKDYPSKGIREATIINLLYSYAYNLYYQGKRHQALDILSKDLKDKHLIDSHMNSFTYDESAKHINKLEVAVFDSASRMIDGEAVKNYIPKEDATCVMDVLGFLQKENAFYVPFSSNVERYKRISRKSEDSFDLFKMTENEVFVPFSSFTYNKKHMNLSILVNIPGSVEINPKSAAKVKLPEKIDASIFRNYTIIKDGTLNMKNIEVLISKESLDKLKKLAPEILSKEIDTKEIEGVVYHRHVLALDKLPIINRMYIDKSLDIKNVFSAVKSINELEARQKMIGYYIDKLMDESSVAKKEGAFKDYTLAQIEVLQEHGLDKNLIYSGISKGKVEVSDSYETRTLELTLAGLKSLPKVDEILDRIQTNKKLTPVMELMEKHRQDIIEKITKSKLDINKPTAKLRNLLRELQEECKDELSEHRNVLNSLKMAKVVTGDFLFPEMKANDKGIFEYEQDGLTMVATVARVTVEI